ncbi:hypothetical protein WICPIJ_004878 [Wickerhamomyces pijperi]|uniref:Uncharacterized protein n=1 Tax=Wickerhamomyces pijperi TaxID=599730 RepID=A0A9P8Q4M4_WICPI|nr:hypothetical protein WICPIJ_004878 [Wickerhamomyces pijperi]
MLKSGRDEESGITGPVNGSNIGEMTSVDSVTNKWSKLSVFLEIRGLPDLNKSTNSNGKVMGVWSELDIIDFVFEIEVVENGTGLEIDQDSSTVDINR